MKHLLLLLLLLAASQGRGQVLAPGQFASARATAAPDGAADTPITMRLYDTVSCG